MNANDKISLSRRIANFTRQQIEGVSRNSCAISEYPKLSVITASFNQAEFLERTILSVLNQNYPNVEHIIIDGGSTDGTLDILKKYGDRIAFWVSESDAGQTNAINKGISMATGDFIGFQNSDDIYLPGAFSWIADTAKANPSASILYGNFLHIDKDDNVLDEVLLGCARLWIQVFLGPQIHNQAAFWRRDLCQELGLLDESYDFDMDYEYFSRLLAGGYKAAHIQEYLGAFRHHGAAKTSNLQSISKKELYQVSELYRNRSPILRYIPRKLGRFMAKFYKATKHMTEGRVDYLFRQKFVFK